MSPHVRGGDTATEMAMFPLAVAHLPGDEVMLRVFEPRYVAMIRTLLSGGDARLSSGDVMVFGSVLILRGSEVGGGDVRAEHGVAVRIDDLAVPPEGGYVVAGRAETVITVRKWLADDPFPRAMVTSDDQSPVPERDQAGLMERLVRTAQMMRLMLVDAARATHSDLLLSAEHRARLGLLAAGRAENLDLEDAFWLLARSVPCGPTDRLALLSVGSLRDRLDTLEKVLDHVREVLAFRLSGP